MWLLRGSTMAAAGCLALAVGAQTWAGPTPGPEVERHLALAAEHARRGHVSDAEMEYGIVLGMDPLNAKAREGMTLVRATATPALALQEAHLNSAERAYRD